VENRIHNTIKQTFLNKNNILIFPSEIAASFWRREVLLSTEVSAIPEESIISWDSFKEKVFISKAGSRPVDSLVRKIFIRELLIENSEEPLLNFLIPREYSAFSEGFTRDFVKLLPLLPEFITSKAALGLKEGLLTDFQNLWERYRRFLRENNLFEPLEGSEGAQGQKEERYVLFFPEIIEDFAAFWSRLGTLHNLSIYKVRSIAPEEIFQYDSVTEEIDMLILRLRELLEQGEDPSKIVVTAGDLESLEFVLYESASKMGVPLSFHSGKPLAQYPAGGIFSRINKLKESGYSLSCMEDLFLDLSYPWKERETFREIIKAGIDGFFPKDLYNGKGWRETLLRSGRGDLFPTLQTFISSVNRILEAGDISSLSGEIYGFLSRSFDPSGWSEEMEKVLRFSLSLLGEIERTTASLKGIKVRDPFGLFLKLLEERIYVPKTRDNAIRVYPFKVSAGICPAHHFIINASQETTSAKVDVLPLLGEDIKARIGLRDSDLRVQFLSLYSESGRRVRVSFARESFTGAQRGPGFLVAQSKVLEDPEKERRDLFFKGETRSWADSSGEPGGWIAPFFSEGFLWARETVFTEKGRDYFKEPVPEKDRRFYTNLLSREGKISLSASKMDSFFNCRFSFFLSYVLDLEEFREFLFFDFREIGLIEHTLLQRLMLSIQNRDKVFIPENIEFYREIALEILEEYFRDWKKERKGIPVKPVFDSLKRRTLESLLTFLETEVETFPGFSLVAAEMGHRVDDFVEGISFFGRIDRISEKEGSAVLIDYKHSKIKAGKRLIPQTPGAQGSYQLPGYIFLGRDMGLTISGASYYAVGEGSYQHLFGFPKSWFQPEEIENLLETFRQSAGMMKKDLEEGVFYKRETMDPSCDYCPFRGVCRDRYVVRN